MITLGQKAKDKVTGLEGILTERTQCLYGCDQYCIKPVIDKENNVLEGTFIDEGRVEITGTGLLNPEELKVSTPETKNIEYLGKEAQDLVTGFKGIITSKWQSLFGTDESLIKPKVDKDGKSQKSFWIKDGRIEIIGKGISPEEVQTKKTGGPQPDAPRC